MSSKVKIIVVMIIWGSIGVFARNISISPILLAFSRAVIALPVVYFFMRNNKQQLFTFIKQKSARPVMLSGMLIGLAWVALFMAYRFTSVGNATLAYNMCPIYVLILAPIVLKEKLSPQQILSVVIAFCGLILIVATSLTIEGANLAGILLGAISGVVYAIIVLINRKYGSHIPSESATFIQLMMSAVVLVPLVLFENPVQQWTSLDLHGIVMLLILGIVHTGIVYQMYFSSYKDLSSTTIALYSYLDPVFAIIFAVVILGEPFGIYQIIGGTLILGSTLISNNSKASASV